MCEGVAARQGWKEAWGKRASDEQEAHERPATLGPLAKDSEAPIHQGHWLWADGCVRKAVGSSLVEDLTVPVCTFGDYL